MNRRNISIILALVIIVVSMPLGIFLKDRMIHEELDKELDKEFSNTPLEGRGKNLIRFHVLANSDEPSDQLLKLRVRDRIIAEMAEEMENSKDIVETRNIIKRNIEKIEKIAVEEIINNNKNYKVSAKLTNEEFPTKRYGGIVFPAGQYETLKVEIGEGLGKNWWCVMFPPLCFVDIKNGMTDEKTQQELKKVLTEEEYEIFYTASQEKELTLQLKSKIVEMYQNSKEKINKLATIF